MNISSFNTWLGLCFEIWFDLMKRDKWLWLCSINLKSGHKPKSWNPGLLGWRPQMTPAGHILYCNNSKYPDWTIFNITSFCCTVQNNQLQQEDQSLPLYFDFILIVGCVSFCSFRSWWKLCHFVFASMQSIYSPEVYLGDNKSPHITFTLNQLTT